MGHFARWVLENPYTLGMLSYILIVLPIMGIWAIHKYGWQHWAPFDKGHRKQYNQFCWEARPLNATGCSSAWIEHRFWEAEVADSNSVTPTCQFHDWHLDYIKSSTYNTQVFNTQQCL